MRFLTISSLVASAAAFPHLSPKVAFEAAAVAAKLQPRLAAEAEAIASRLQPRIGLPGNLPLSQFQGNSGPFPSTSFSEEDQFVDVRPGTKHEYRAPGPGDKRGPCPGLNAAANHGFLPRNGIANIEQTIVGLDQAYSFGADFSGPLAVIAIVLTGDLTSLTWSIGEGYQPALLGKLLSDPEGISFSHNSYESDASIVRQDAYLNGGDASSLLIDRFDKLYFSATNFTLDVMRDFNKYVHDYSVQNNPYFYLAPFAGLVPPIAHHFVINLMSNHSAENIQGYFNRDMLKTFFAVDGPDDAHVWLPGQEQIPQNWYKRPSDNPYGAVAAVLDVVILITKYPEVIQIGGNLGRVNTFTGVNLADLTGGVFQAGDLLEGNNLGCFLFQVAQQAFPAELQGLLSGILSPVLNLVNSILSPVTKVLDCPALLQLNDTLLNQYPGKNYKPTSSKLI